MSLIQGFLDGLRPTPSKRVSEWADENRYLSSESAAEPGRWRTSRTPFLQQVMDDLSPMSSVNEVVVAKGVQLGFSESALNVVGCFIDISPCPIMYVMPTIDMANAISQDRITPMIENSPTLKARVAPQRSRDATNTIRVKSFPGGRLILSGGNSAASLRSRPVKVLILDEVDAYPLDVEGEGSPVALAEKRTSTFGDRRKVYKLSTPTIEGQSIIQKELEKTEINRFHVPCPHCGSDQWLKFEQFRWEKGQPETVLYECEHCGDPIEERFKTRMLAAGTWRATMPANRKPKIRGYHISSLYSPLGWLSWEQIIRQYEDAEKDPNLMKVFVNTILGDTYKDTGESPPWENLFNRREPYQLNRPSKDVVFLTAGVDIQGDRIEAEIVGWCADKSSYSIDRRVLLGNPAYKDVWDKLAQIVSEQWESEDGRQMSLQLMAVDTGYLTQHVYDFCNRFDETRVIPVKGQDSQKSMVSAPSQVGVTRDGKKVGRVKVWNIGVSMIKSELYAWLRLERDEHGVAPAGYCHFPEYDVQYFKGLTAEELQSKVVKGFTRYEWVKKFERNEPLDLRVYARAAANVIGLDRWTPADFEYVRQSYHAQTRTVAPRKRSGGSSFWD